MFLFIPAVLVVVGSVVYSPVLAENDQEQNRTCVANPSGAVSLSVDVVGVPGAPGPQGSQGGVGPVGDRGMKGQQGVMGQKGMLGGAGPKGNEGQRGPTGIKGQKGIRGAEGPVGPTGEHGVEGVAGPRGHPGADGPRGPFGPAGRQGIRGPQGEPGDTVLNKEEFERIRQQVYSSVLADINATLESVDQKLQLLMDADAKINNNLDILNTGNAKQDDKLRGLEDETSTLGKTLQALNNSQQECCAAITMCGIPGLWSKVRSFNTSNGNSCPSPLSTVTSQDGTKRACGRQDTSSGGCSSVSIPVYTEYSRVCGIVRGYQYSHPDAFGGGASDLIDSHFVDGISITHGSPRRHLWTYANGLTEQGSVLPSRCPCARSNPLDRSDVPSFVGEHFYCESGFVDNDSPEVAWNDPLWDGASCHSPGNQCCQRFGWFHRQVQPSTDDIELRLCQDASGEDTLLESYEFWVM